MAKKPSNSLVNLQAVVQVAGWREEWHQWPVKVRHQTCLEYNCGAVLLNFAAVDVNFGQLQRGFAPSDQIAALLTMDSLLGNVCCHLDGS